MQEDNSIEGTTITGLAQQIGVSIGSYFITRPCQNGSVFKYLLATSILLLVILLLIQDHLINAVSSLHFTPKSSRMVLINSTFTGATPKPSQMNSFPTNNFPKGPNYSQGPEVEFFIIYMKSPISYNQSYDKMFTCTGPSKPRNSFDLFYSCNTTISIILSSIVYHAHAKIFKEIKPSLVVHHFVSCKAISMMGKKVMQDKPRGGSLIPN